MNVRWGFPMSSKSPEPREFLDGITHVLFDMDGVLLDTEPLYTLAYDQILAPYGARLDWETKSTMMGRPATDSAALLIDKFNLPLEPAELLAVREPVLDKLFRDAPAMPGAPEFVAGLKQRGVRLAVATSSYRALFELKTAKHPWFSLFDVVVCGDDPELERPKPAPDIFLLAAQRLGVEAQNSVIFEDSPAGVQAAVATEARVVALVDPRVDRRLYADAFCVVESYAELGVA